VLSTTPPALPFLLFSFLSLTRALAYVLLAVGSSPSDGNSLHSKLVGLIGCGGGSSFLVFAVRFTHLLRIEWLGSMIKRYTPRTEESEAPLWA